ncbi:MAG: hypothetical protein CVU38_03265 [Chloroflexi bacterium HGW-Chloroflexi-1]|nr:MAG: hypothetical protein CVU38_03265 [Chloroflexi bacterium HGW-Chloroflexi-1]
MRTLVKLLRHASIAFVLPGLLLAGSAAVSHAADPVAAAVAWLHTQQLSDGSFGVSNQGSAGLTADVVYVLALVGEDPAGPAWTVNGHSALAALAALASPYAARDAGQAGKVARAVALAGGDPRSFGGLDLVNVIQAAYDPATGRYHPSLLFRHTLAVEGLYRSGAPASAQAIEALSNAQMPDGGWFWAFEGVEGDVDTTGRVLQVLAGYAGVRCTAAFDRAVDFLAAGQLATGGWGVRYGEGPANADSTALVVAGLRAVGNDPAAARFQKAGRGAVETLLTFQAPSGAFVYIQQPGQEESRIMATVDALTALAQPQLDAPICHPVYLPLSSMRD